MDNVKEKYRKARENSEKLKTIIRSLSMSIDIVDFRRAVCPNCPHTCSGCFFCYSLFKYTTTRCYINMLERLVHAFYCNVDVSNICFLIYNLCPVCDIGCNNITEGRDCPYSYARQMCASGVTNEITEIKKPLITISGQTIQRVINTVLKNNKRFEA